MLTIRRGLPEDAQDFVKLFLLSSPYFPVVFGGRIVNVLEGCFRGRRIFLVMNTPSLQILMVKKRACFWVMIGRQKEERISKPD